MFIIHTPHRDNINRRDNTYISHIKAKTQSDCFDVWLFQCPINEEKSVSSFFRLSATIMKIFCILEEVLFYFYSHNNYYWLFLLQWLERHEQTIFTSNSKNDDENGIHKAAYKKITTIATINKSPMLWHIKDITWLKLSLAPFYSLHFLGTKVLLKIPEVLVKRKNLTWSGRDVDKIYTNLICRRRREDCWKRWRYEKSWVKGSR